MLGWLLCGTKASPTLSSLALVYKTIDAVILRPCNSSLICTAPFCTSCSKDFQVDGWYATGIKSTPYLVQICCMVASATSARSKAPIEQPFWYAVITHSSDMACPSQDCALYHGLYATNIASCKNFIIGYIVKPSDSGNLPQRSLVKLFQLSNMIPSKGPCFTTK